MIFFCDDLEMIDKVDFYSGITSEGRFKGFPHCHSASPSSRKQSSLTQNAILSSFSGDQTFLLGSSWFKGSHDFALSRIKGRGRYSCLRFFGEPRFAFKIFRTRSFTK